MPRALRRRAILRGLPRSHPWRAASSRGLRDRCLRDSGLRRPSVKLGMTSWPIIPPGIWYQQSSPRLAAMRPALFLDRDGVVIEQVEYIHRAEDVILHDGAAGLIGWLNRLRIPTILIVNQSGVSRGLYNWAEFAAVQAELEKQLSRQDARLDAVAACPFHPEFTPGWGAEHAAWRKPGANMILHAAASMNIDRSRSCIVGDTASDIEAARNAGLAGGIHVLTGHGRRERPYVPNLARPDFPVVAADGISACRELLASLPAYADLAL